MRHELRFLSIVEVCPTCGNEDLLEYDDELGFEGQVVTVCAVCGAVCDPVTGEQLDEGQA